MHWFEMLVTIIGSVFASSGFWAFLQSKRDHNDSKTGMIVGIAHNTIIETGMRYISRGWVTKDEYEDFIKYLYDPYEKFGGNGMARKVKKMVDDLPMFKSEKEVDERRINDGTIHYTRDGSDDPFGA